MPVESHPRIKPDLDEQTRVHHRASEIFSAAVLRHPTERAAYLDAVCGDDQAVRHEVEALLAHDSDHDIARTSGPRRIVKQLASMLGLRSSHPS